jgi:hypothetical protein
MGTEGESSVSKFLDDMKLQCAQAGKTIRALKKITPEVFVEHAELIHAKAELRSAKERYDRALAAWRRLGNNA